MMQNRINYSEWLCCSNCKKKIDYKDEKKGKKWVCSYCKTTYPIIFGIPDFRLQHHEYCFKEGEEKKLTQLLERYKQNSFEELAIFSKSFDGDPPALCNQYLKYKLDQVEWSEKLWPEKNYALSLINKQWPKMGFALELGCGWGNTIINLSRQFEAVVGVDINLCELIMAKKFIEEKLKKDIFLVCASAENMPFKSSRFVFVNANDVIEHVHSPEKSIKEVYRVLDEKGIFYFNSPNRYSLLHKEGHVQIYGVGFVPRKWQKEYVRLFVNHNYKSIYLRSHFELKKILNSTFSKNWKSFNHFIDYSTAPQTWKGRFIRMIPKNIVSFLFENWVARVFSKNHRFVCVK